MFKVCKKPFAEKFLYRVLPEDNFESIAKKFGTSAQRFKQDNTIDTLYDGCVLYVNTVRTKKYVVKPLDTLESIAKKLNVDKKILLEKNKITRLYIGQKLEY